MEINYYDKPTQTLETLLDKYKPDIYLILEDVLSSNRTFKFVYQDLLDILKWGFEIKEIRTKPIYFKFKKDSEIIYTLELRNFLSNMIFWQAFIEMDRVDLLDESYIIDFKNFNLDTMIDYCNNKILIDHLGDFASQNKTIDEICYHITAISNAFSLLMGMSISLYDINEAMKRNPEMEDIIFGEIDKTLQPVEIEQELSRRTKRLMELFKNDIGNNDLKPLFLAGKILSEGQFKEMFVKIGFKADINGHTIPYLIDDNFIVTGLRTPSSQYISALGGCKSLILTKTSMGKRKDSYYLIFLSK